MKSIAFASWPALVAAALVTAATSRAGLPLPPEYDYEAPEPGSYALPPIQDAADGQVLGPDGQPRRLHDLLQGRITLLSFIYTRCADPRACPRTSGVLYKLHGQSAEDPALARSLQLITMSFDPIHDTPERMAAYGRGFLSGRPGAPWYFLTAPNEETLRPLLKAYGQVVDRKKDPKDAMGPLNHNIRVYLIDRRGRVRNIYSFGLMDPRLLLSDVRTLLLEEEDPAAAHPSTE